MLSKEQRDSLRRFPVCGLRAEDVRAILDTCDELERERDEAQEEFQNMSGQCRIAVEQRDELKAQIQQLQRQIGERRDEKGCPKCGEPISCPNCMLGIGT